MAKEQVQVAIGLLLSVLSAGEVCGQRQSYVRTSHYVDEVLRIQKSEFTPERLRGYARQFAGKHKSVEFAKLLVGTGEEMRDYVGKGTTGQSVDGYFFRLPVEFPQGLHTWSRLAMVLKVGHAVLLRVRVDGAVTETFISGGRELLPGWTKGFEILDFAQFYDPPDTISGIRMFVRNKGALNEREVESVADELCVLLPNFEFDVHARQDSLFILHDRFPFLYAFDPGYELPNPKTFDPEAEICARRKHCKGR
jgi:hypothetical protein